MRATLEHEFACVLAGWCARRGRGHAHGGPLPLLQAREGSFREASSAEPPTASPYSAANVHPIIAHTHTHTAQGTACHGHALYRLIQALALCARAHKHCLSNTSTVACTTCSAYLTFVAVQAGSLPRQAAPSRSTTSNLPSPLPASSPSKPALDLAQQPQQQPARKPVLPRVFPSTPKLARIYEEAELRRQARLTARARERSDPQVAASGALCRWAAAISSSLLRQWLWPSWPVAMEIRHGKNLIIP